MNKKEILAIIENLCHEADILLSRNSGMHNMYGYRAAIYACLSNVKNDIYKENSYDAMSNLDFCIKIMRIADLNKSFPHNKENRPAQRKIKFWKDVGK